VIAEGEQGAVTGPEDMHVTNKLHMEGLSLLANAPGALQNMLNKLVVYACS